MKDIFKLIFNITITLIISSTLVFSSLAVPIKDVEAGGLGSGLATEFSNIKISVLQTVGNVSAAATAGATTGTFLKENLLDGIGWAIAKQMVSSMTRSLINWINSGFQGKPAFIADFKGFLLNSLDSVAGEYIKSLGGIGNFICSPFKLDVQAALSINYAQARSGMPSGPTACTLTGIKDNIQNFMQGTMSGWDQWFKVTSNTQNTPYGAYLEAEAKLNARLVNEKGEQIQIANWGDGFLSKKICEGINGKKSPGGRCTITTPGKVISEALTFQLSTGPRALIEADEINELIGALINQLMLKAMQGVAGLLGLSAGTGYTDYSYDDGSGASSTRPYIDAAVDQTTSSSSLSLVRNQLGAQLITEQAFLYLINDTIIKANEKLNSLGTSSATSTPVATTTSIVIDGSLTSTTSTSTTIIFNGLDSPIPRVTTIPDLIALITEVTNYKETVKENIKSINTLILNYDNAISSSTPDRSANVIRQEVLSAYVSLVSSNILTPRTLIDIKRVEWSGKLE